MALDGASLKGSNETEKMSVGQDKPACTLTLREIYTWLQLAWKVLDNF